MESRFKQMTEFIRKIGADEVKHSDKTYLAHAIGVHNDLETWGCDEDVCRAGIFHSIYGTERFQKFVLPLDRRGELQELIGEKAERLAYLNCCMDRDVFDKLVFQAEAPFLYKDRFTDTEIEITPDEFRELYTIQLCDWLEQVPRSKAWDYRRKGYRQMADRLGGIALESYERVFSQGGTESAV